VSETSKNDFIYVTTVGRKTGNPHQIEIWYVEYNGAYYLCSENRDSTDWFKNIIKTPAVTYGFGGWNSSQSPAVGRPVTEPDLIDTLKRLFDAKYQWSDGAFMEIKPV
jgi:hypothetical protein